MIHESIRSKIQYMINTNIVFKINITYIYKSAFSIIINLGSRKWTVIMNCDITDHILLRIKIFLQCDAHFLPECMVKAQKGKFT